MRMLEEERRKQDEEHDAAIYEVPLCADEAGGKGGADEADEKSKGIGDDV